jgi:diguanylate cyclase (GGDEF)-like protein
MELETFNEHLSNLSLTDELTGLFNRRGFLKLASQQLNVIRQMGKNALLIYGDVDGLKVINDKYGHGEGDFVIKSAAEVLRRVFRSMDIIARLGGDEFTVFASNTNEKQISYFQARLSEILEEINSDSGKPYKISISLGCAECLSGSDSTLDDYMRMADAMLYDQKAKRKRKSP